MANRIDTHFHMIPPFWAEALTTKTGEPMWGMPAWSPDTARQAMDRLGTRVGVISLATPSVMAWEGQEQLEMTRRVNDYGCELREKAGGRLGYFATLPMPDSEATVAEIKRAYGDYAADGVIMLTSYKGVYLGDKRFTPVWEELERYEAVIFLHPGIPEIKPLEGVPQPTFDFPMDTTRAALDLVVTGVMDRYPSVKIILSHAGGFLPYSVTRFTVLLHAYTMKDMSEDEIRQKFRRFYFDTALSAPDALPSLLGFADPKRIVFGSDNPYIGADTQARFTRATDEFFGMPDGLLDAIDHKNAEILFPRLRT